MPHTPGLILTAAWCLLMNDIAELWPLHTVCFFPLPQQQNFAMGSLAQISSGAIRCSFNTGFRTRFRRVLVQIPREVPEGSGADTSWGSGGFRWRYTCWGSGGFCAVPEGSGADTLWGSGEFWCRYLVRFRKFSVQVLGEVPEGYSADTCLGF